MRKKPDLVATIDIGTNTVLLFVGYARDGKLISVREEQRVPRLGRNVDESRVLHPDSMNRVLQALLEYKAIIAGLAVQYHSDQIPTMVTATSAVRDAGNRDDFTNLVLEHTGWNIRLLSGDEEASWTFRGALAMLPDTLKSEYDTAVVFDIGGGSTETAAGSLTKRPEPDYFHSVDAGCVRFTERFFKGNDESSYLPDSSVIKQCRKAIRKVFDEAGIKGHLNELIHSKKTLLSGVAGTVTTLAYMEAGLSKYEPEVLNGMNISRKILQKWIEYASTHNPEEMVHDFPVVMEGRADIVLSGLLILDEFMELAGFSSLVVSIGGIRHGAANQLLTDYL